MRPIRFAGVITLLIGTSIAAAQVVYPAGEPWRWVMWGCAGLTVVLFGASFFWPAKPQNVPRPAQVETKLLDTGGGGALMGDRNSGNNVYGGAGNQYTIHHHHVPDLSHLPPLDGKTIGGVPPAVEPKQKVELKLMSAVYELGMRDAAGQSLPECMAYMVKATNVSRQMIGKCQLMFGLKGGERYPVTRIFHLRRGEDMTFPVFRYKHNNADDRPFMYFLDDEYKIKNVGPSLLLGGGMYEVTLLSADTDPISIDVYIGDRREKWRVRPG